MRRVFYGIMFLLLIFSGCESPEEVVVPIPPQKENIPPAEPEITDKVSEKPKPTANKTQSDDFLAGKFHGMPYRILIPRHYDSTKHYPIHVFLHGIGERGADNERQLAVGASRFQADSIREEYPAFIVFPQCPSSQYWFNNEILQQLKGLIDDLVADYRIDEDNISIGGFSMGAYGTFEMVAQNPGLFESAIAISGDGDTRDAALMAKPRWRIFAGAHDEIVPSVKTEQMAEALKKAGAAVSFTLYPTADHGHTWVHAFSEPDYFAWLFRADDNVDNSGDSEEEEDADE